MTLEFARTVLASCWASLMLVYLLGDVLRIFAGDFKPGEIDGKPAPSWSWTLAALIMLVPIVMILTSLLAPLSMLGWGTTIAAIALAIFNLAGLPYPGMYDNLLIIIGIALNAFTVWFVWAQVVSSGNSP